MDRQATLRHAFGQRLRAYRRAARLTQRELGLLAGMHPKYIGGVERGERNICIDNVERLATALRVAPQSLFPADRPVGPSARGPQATTRPRLRRNTHRIG